MENFEGRIRVFKAKNHDVKAVAYCTKDGEIGADTTLEEFLKAVAQEYGNPTLTMSVAGHEEKLIEAALKVIQSMKQTTRAVASLNLGKVKP